MTKKKQTRLSMKLLWKLYREWWAIADIGEDTNDFLEFVEKEMRSVK